MKYYKLTTNEDWDGMVVKSIGQDWYGYYKDKGWIETGVMSLFWFDFSKYYDEYVEIPEDEALKLIHDKEYKY